MIKWWRRLWWKHRWRFDIRPYVLVSTKSVSEFPLGSEPSETIYGDIRMGSGDTTTITWKIEIGYDPKRRVVEIFSNNRHIGSMAAECGYKSTHTAYIDFKRR